MVGILVSFHQLFGLLCRSGVIRDHHAHSHCSHRPQNWSDSVPDWLLSQHSVINLSRLQKSCSGVKVVVRVAIYLSYVEQFPLIQTAVNVIYSLTCRGRPGTPQGLLEGTTVLLWYPRASCCFPGMRAKMKLYQLKDLSNFTAVSFKSHEHSFDRISEWAPVTSEYSAADWAVHDEKAALALRLVSVTS